MDNISFDAQQTRALASRVFSRLLWISVFGLCAVSAEHHARGQEDEGARPAVTNGEKREYLNRMFMKFRPIPAGKFMIGSKQAPKEVAKTFGVSESDWFRDEHPKRTIEISRPFYMSATEVTRGTYRTFAEETGYKSSLEKKNGWDGENWWNVGFPQDDDHPVVNVSWYDAAAFCRWLSEKDGKKYRLPTEAEWQYTCRAGAVGHYCYGDGPESLVGWGNVLDDTGRVESPPSYRRYFEEAWTPVEGKDGFVFTCPVGRFKSNECGVFDTHGNVSEWCADWYGEESYASMPARDPKGPETGEARVVRGGGWRSPAWAARSASRDRFDPGVARNDLGFRVVLEDWESGL